MFLQARILSGVSFAALAIAAFPSAALAQVEDCGALASQAERDACAARQAAAATATAQEQEDDANIVVTGSRIARPNFDTNAPAVIIDSEEIENRGLETLGQAINEQPSFGVPGSSPVGGQGGSFGSGQSFVNFLGLGSQRTLVLVNGRRFVSSNTATIFGPAASGLQVDLNTINTRLVERIETIAIGGAPIYGSDAIAGTINVITRQDFEGFEIDGQYGIAERGDAANYRIRGLWGANFSGGRGNVLVFGEYNKGEGLLLNDRERTRRSLFYRRCNPGSQFNQCLFENRRIPYVSEAGVVTVGGDVFGLNFPLSPDDQVLVFGAEGFGFSATDAQGNPLQFDAAGNLIPIDFGQPIGLPSTFSIDFSGGNGFNLTNTQQLLTDTERYNVTLLANYQLTDNVRLFD